MPLGRAFSNLSIGTKFILPLVLVALIGAGVGGYAVRTLLNTDKQYSTLLEREGKAATYAARLNLLTLDLARATWRALAFPDQDGLASVVRDIEAMEAEFASRLRPVQAAVAGTPMAADLAVIERDFPTLRLAALRGLRQVQAGQAEAGRASLRADVYAQIGALRTVNRKLTQQLEQTAETRSAALTEESIAALRVTVTALAIGLLTGLGVALWLVRSTILRPFGRLDGSMRSLADGNLETSVGDTDRADELGNMARALQGFATSLREAAALRTAQEEQQRRTEQAPRDGLLAMVDSLESSVGTVVDGIASATTELSAAATSMVGIADATSQRAGTVSGATAVASGNVGTVAAATEELAASVAEISRQVSDSARMAAGAVDQANRTNATVANLTEAAAKIGEVTRLIGDIAGQTNLLALNATIEAARAGEAGKGFAVVASEVKALANQTAQATGSIATQIQAMQAATRDAAADIGAIRESIGQINQVTAAIAAAVEEQGAATREIARNVAEAAQGTNDVSANIAHVSAGVEETTGALAGLRDATGAVARQGGALRDGLSGLLQGLRAA